ncbi:hypothetical protein [Exiguobacterium sp. UBA5002]|uniref:hypothetical protein n=1 Tax=Exiguobacterium sp. UBA5002 TaxID=1946497 RepID=UPI0025BA5097|nr:hypothetical protein [Exiguobacterium sp. UBA5002]
MKKSLVIGIVSALCLGGSNVSALVSFPNTASIASAEKLVISADQSHVWAMDANEFGSKAFDVKTGAKIHTLEENMKDFTVSDDGTRHIALVEAGFVVYDATLQPMQSKVQTISINQEKVENFSYAVFVPNSHTVIFLADESDEGKLIGYDLDKKVVTFVRGTQQFGELLTSKQYVYVKGEEAVYVYTHDGKFIREIPSVDDTVLNDIDVTRDDVLVVAEDATAVHVYDGKNDFQTVAPRGFVTETDRGVQSVAIDPSGSYVATLDEDEQFRLFDRSGRRIFTSLDKGDDFTKGPIAMTDQANTIMIGSEEGTNLYDGSKVMERTTSILIPKVHAAIQAGKKQTLQLTVQQFDGKAKSIRTGVKWSMTSKTVQIKKGILYGVKPGSYTLKATYEGLSVTLKGKVTQAPLASLSDVDWLKRHWANIEKSGTFEGAYPFSTPFNQIKGSKGTISLANSDGVFHGPLIKDLLYRNAATMQYPKSNRLGIVFLVPALSERKLQKQEILQAFGRKYKNLWLGNGTADYTVEKGKKVFARYGIKTYHQYVVGKSDIIIYYDQNDIARMISISQF